MSPNFAYAIAAQIAACVYCPPFSLTPGTYPLIYPGFIADLSNGGFSTWIRLLLRLTRCLLTESIAIRERLASPAPDNTDQLCEMESIWHSGFFADPRGEPSSNKARRYHSPSHPFFSRFF